MSIKRVAESVSLDIWVPATLEAARALCAPTYPSPLTPNL